MRKFVTLAIVAVALASATSAFAVDSQMRSPANGPAPHHVGGPFSVNTVLGCDNGNFFNAYFQNQNNAYGNLFSFGASSVLSRVSFLHFGFGFSGPYNYSLQVWDPTSCTMVTQKTGLVAADAADAEQVEVVELCSDNITLSGNKIVAVLPLTCLAANDCYPDVAFDDQINVLCPYVVAATTTTPACTDLSVQSGPFLLRAETNACAVPTSAHSWGQVKSFYR